MECWNPHCNIVLEQIGYNGCWDFYTDFFNGNITIFPKSINNVIGLGIRGTGDTKWMPYGQMLGTVLVITLSYVLIFTAKLGLWGIFITLLVDETVRGIINLLRFLKGREFFFLKLFEKTSDKGC